MDCQANIDVVRRIYDLFADGDENGMRSLLADDFEWDFYGPSSIPWAGKYRGVEGFDQFFARVREVVEVEHFEPREFIGADDRVVVLGISRSRVLASGARYEAQWANVFTLRDGRITRLIDLYETASVVRALEAPTRDASQQEGRVPS